VKWVGGVVHGAGSVAGRPSRRPATYRSHSFRSIRTRNRSVAHSASSPRSRCAKQILAVPVRSFRSCGATTVRVGQRPKYEYD
jgi:hypothetical protein